MLFGSNEHSDRIRSVYEAKQIILPKEEYANLMSELNTHMSEEERKSRIVTKAIGNFYYTIINNGFNDYKVISKYPILEGSDSEWED